MDENRMRQLWDRLFTPTVPAESFCATLAANVDNKRLSDADFRQFVRNTLSIVIYPRPEPPRAE